MVRRMGIFFGVAEGMVHAMHDSIGTRIQIRRPLSNNGEKIKEPFPEGGKLEHPVGSVAV